MTDRPIYDLEAALEQAVYNETRGTRMLREGDSRGHWHLVDAAQNYEDAGRAEDAARVRKMLAAPSKVTAAAHHEAAAEAPHEPDAEAGEVQHASPRAASRRKIIDR